MRTLRIVGAAIVIAVPVGLGVVGCGSSDLSTKSYSTDGNCIQLSDNLSNARNDLKVASTHLEDDKGKPSAVKDKTDQALAKQNIAKLNAALKAHGWENGCDKKSSDSSSAAANAADCTRTWAIKTDQHKDGNFISDGLESIRHARTDEQAKAAADDWIDKMKTDVGNLAFVIKTVLKQDVSVDRLEDGSKCATDVAAGYVTQLHDTVSQAVVKAGDAPADGTNTGSQDDTGVASATTGVSGDRTAITVTLPDGWKFSVLARCANVVFHETAPSSVPVTTTPIRTTEHKRHTTTATRSTAHQSTTPARPTPTVTPTPTPTPTPTGKHASLSPTPTGGGNPGGTTSVSHPSPTATTTTQTTESTTPSEVQNPSPTSSSPPVVGDPGGA